MEEDSHTPYSPQNEETETPVSETGTYVPPQHESPPPPEDKGSKRLAPERLFPRFIRQRLGSAARPLSILLILLIIGGGSVAAWTITRNHASSKPIARFEAVLPPFRVVSTTPSPNDSNVNTATSITLRFSRPVDPSKINGDFFTSPSVKGTFSAGKNDKEIVFKPAIPFDQGVSVKIMLHGEFQSTDGSKLGSDFFFGFTTSTPDNGVIFQRQDFLDIVGSAPANKTQNYTLMVGKDVSPSGTITVYKSDMTSLLDSLVYQNKTTDGYTYPDFINGSVDTSGMQALSTKSGLKDGDTFPVTEDKGVYLIAATSNGQQVGHTWLVFSNFGLLLKQDDQKVVMAAEQLNDSSLVSAKVTLYNLESGVSELASSNINGLQSVNLPLSPSLDVAVATSGDDQAIAPVSVLYSLADIRTTQDLSTKNTIFGLTDKPTYKVGETVNYAGYVRSDNDAQYTLPGSEQLGLYVATSPYDNHLADFTAPVGSDGNFSGHFSLSSDFLPQGQTSQLLHIYAVNQGKLQTQTDTDVASFTVTSQPPPSYEIKVSFNKQSYVANESVSAHISGTNSDGKPLANTPVTVNIYSKDYYETDPASNLQAFDEVGSQVGTSQQVKLDASGQTTVPIDISKLPAGSSQTVTVQADTKDPAGVDAAGGSSTVIHEGNAILRFGPAKTVIQPGGSVVARVYASTLSGTAIANTEVDYKLIASNYDNSSQTYVDKTIASGSVKTDGNGFASISQPISSQTDGSLELDVSTSDSSNNMVEATSYYYIQNPNNSIVYSELQLSQLDISGTSGEVSVGDKINLKINSPQAVNALVTLERGRIHKYEMVKLNQGDNSYSINVTPDLAPSFTLVLSYFSGGSYHIEGTSFDVTDPSKAASIQFSPDLASYSAGQTATVQISAKDNQGNPLPTNMIVGIVSANSYDLYDQVVPDMLGYLYSPRELTTNSSSSLTGIGSGGGKCGGGGFDQPELSNPNGTVLLWSPDIKTDSNGKATVKAVLPKGSWRMYAYSMNNDTVVGSSSTVLTAN